MKAKISEAIHKSTARNDIADNSDFAYKIEIEVIEEVIPQIMPECGNLVREVHDGLIKPIAKLDDRIERLEQKLLEQTAARLKCSSGQG